MLIKISKKQLEKLSACPDGIKLFEETIGFDTEVDWTREKQIEILTKTELRKYFVWAVYHLLIPQWSMSGANMSWANMSWANMSWANMSWANMSGANMSRANMSWANMSGVDMSNTILLEANLTNTIRLLTDDPITGWELVNGRLQKASK